MARYDYSTFQLCYLRVHMALQILLNVFSDFYLYVRVNSLCKQKNVRYLLLACTGTKHYRLNF